jgi:hypothetical protein
MSDLTTKEIQQVNSIMDYYHRMKSGDTFARKVIFFLGVAMDTELLVNEALLYGVDPNIETDIRIRKAVLRCGFTL